MAKDGMVIVDTWMRRIAPAASGHINVDGLWAFSYSGFRDQLIQPERPKQAQRRTRPAP